MRLKRQCMLIWSKLYSAQNTFLMDHYRENWTKKKGVGWKYISCPENDYILRNLAAKSDCCFYMSHVILHETVRLSSILSPFPQCMLSLAKKKTKKKNFISEAVPLSKHFIHIFRQLKIHQLSSRWIRHSG